MTITESCMDLVGIVHEGGENLKGMWEQIAREMREK
jgi:hypothetical protein